MADEFNVDLTGKVAVVTGATTGLGKEIARGLLRLGATIVLNTRDVQRGTAARAELSADAKHDDAVSVLPMDVSDQASIRSFAAMLQESHPRLDLLVNNAGGWFSDRRESVDGIELTFATNVVGPYLLTNLLLDQLRSTDHARVINIVSSIAGNYDATDLNFTRRGYDGFKSYSQSKQALRMLTWGLAERVAGSGVTANAAAPGFVRTELNRNAHGARVAMINVMARWFAVSPTKGADTPLWAAVSPELRDTSGKYFADRAEKDGGFHDPAAIADLEQRCDELTRATLGGSAT